MINLTIISEGTSMASFGRAMHEMDITRSCGSVKISCKRYNKRCSRNELTFSDDNIVKMIEGMLRPVMRLIAA